jgi:hypothetical protein
MPKPYDAVARELLDRFPGAVLTYTGQRPPGPIELIEAKIGTVTAEPDKVIRVAGPRRYLIHIEAQAGRDFRLPHRLRWYNTLLDYKHKLRVQSIAILSHPRADTHDLTGVLDLHIPDGDRVDTFYLQGHPRLGAVRGVDPPR